MVMNFIDLFKCLLICGCRLNVESNRNPSSSRKTQKQVQYHSSFACSKFSSCLLCAIQYSFHPLTTHYYQFVLCQHSLRHSAAPGCSAPCLQTEVLLERTPENFAFDRAKHQNEKFPQESVCKFSSFRYLYSKPASP